MIGIEGKNGVEIMLHLGINTVELEGKYFETFIKVGDKVKKGQLIVTYNIEAIKKLNYDDIAILVITNSNDFKIMDFHQNNTINKDEFLLSIEAV